jgi:hypothetical protein
MGADRQRATLKAILSYAAELERREPEEDILDTFNRCGLDAMLDYSEYHRPCDSDPSPAPAAAPQRQRQSSVRVVKGEK